MNKPRQLQFVRAVLLALLLWGLVRVFAKQKEFLELKREVATWPASSTTIDTKFWCVNYVPTTATRRFVWHCSRPVGDFREEKIYFGRLTKSQTTTKKKLKHHAYIIRVQFQIIGSRMVADVLRDNREYCYELDDPKLVPLLDENWKRLEFSVQYEPLRVQQHRPASTLLEIRIPSSLLVEFERTAGSASLEKYYENPVFKLDF